MKTLVFLALFLASPSLFAEVLHEGSYVMTVGAGQKYGAYTEKLEKIGKELKYTNDIDKLEDGLKVKELTTVTVDDNDDLKPALLFFQKNGGMNALKIDGTRQKDGSLLFKSKINGAEGPQLTRAIAPRQTFTSMLPFWIKRNEKKFEKGKSSSVTLLLEDDIANKFKPKTATIRGKDADSFAKENKAKLYEVDFMNQKSLWWIGPKGEMIKNEYPSSKLVIRKVSPSEAKNFLGQ